MKAIIWKEWRENGAWGILAMLGLALGLSFAVYHEVGRGGSADDNTIPIWGTANLVLALGAPLAGLGLGLLQILPEMRRDQWAFLIHRPVSRTVLFFGKVIPGLCLYLLATSLPLLGLAIWDAMPGHVAAPFDWGFTLGGWTSILSGVALYFAGLLTALRPARWYGSRPLPILAALLAILFDISSEDFWPVLLSYGFAIAVLLTASWGSFQTTGQGRGQPSVGKLGLGITLYVGSAVTAVGAFLLAASAYQAVFPAPPDRAENVFYGIDAEGHIGRDTQDAENRDHFTDLNGKPYLIPTRRYLRPGQAEFLQMAEVASPWMGQREDGRYNMPSRYAQPLQTFLYKLDDTAWYYAYAQNQAVGYSTHTRRAVGYLGPRGFADTPQGAGRFTEPLIYSLHRSNTSGLLQFSHSVYLFDTYQRTLNPLWTATGGEKIQNACYLDGAITEVSGLPLVIATNSQFHVFSEQGRLLFTTPRLLNDRAYVRAGVAPRLNRFFFWYNPDPIGFSGLGSSQIVTLSGEGHVLKTQTLPPLRPPYVSAPAFAPAGLALPPFVTALMVGDDLIKTSNGRAAWKSISTGMGSSFWPLFSTLGGLLSALLAWCVSLRCGDDRRRQFAWAFGVFWLGPYGVLMLLALREWPARVPCPVCRRLRVVSRDTCEHCGAPFARPRRDGTEIFDDAGRENDPIPAR